MLTALKNMVDIKNMNLVGSEIPTAVTMKHAVFWDVTPCSPVDPSHTI
jgi:hypothetical protein